MDRAVSYQEQALGCVAGRLAEHFATLEAAEQVLWYRRAERYNPGCCRLRQQESRRNPAQPTNSVDASVSEIEI